MPKIGFYLRAGVVAALLTGAVFATSAAQAADPTDLSGLTKISNANFDQVYAKDGQLPKGFTAVYVEPIGVLRTDKKAFEGLSDSDIREMQDYFHRQLVSALSTRFKIVDKAGPGVLDIQASFTTLRPNRLTMTQMQKKPDLDYMRSYAVGAAGVQIEVRDGANDELLAEFVDKDVGDPLFENLNIHIPWGDAEQFCRRWADQLTRSLGHN
jgi:hypothetical protein